MNFEFGHFPELTKRAQTVKYKHPIKSEIITRCEIEKWHDPPSASFDNLIVDVRSFSEEFQCLPNEIPVFPEFLNESKKNYISRFVLSISC